MPAWLPLTPTFRGSGMGGGSGLGAAGTDVMGAAGVGLGAAGTGAGLVTLSRAFSCSAVGPQAARESITTHANAAAAARLALGADPEPPGRSAPGSGRIEGIRL